MKFYPRVLGPTRIKEVDEIEYSSRDLRTMDCPGGANHEAYGTKGWNIANIHYNRHISRRREINIQKIINNLLKNVDRGQSGQTVKQTGSTGHKTQ